MFNAMVQNEAFQALLAGETVQMAYMPPGDSGMDDETVFTDVRIQCPEDGTHCMILNGEKFFVRVTSGSNGDECPCCVDSWLLFKIVG